MRGNGGGTNGIELVGAIKVARATIPWLRRDSFLLYRLAFLRKAGWQPSWADGTLRVEGVRVRERVGAVQLHMFGGLHDKYRLSLDGCYAPEGTMPKYNPPAEQEVMFTAPVYSMRGTAFCPWCRGELRYARGGVDWCDECCTYDTGPLPGPGSVLWEDMPENMLTSYEDRGEVVAYNEWHGHSG